MPRNESILVVGGAGYIGSHVVRSLKARGYEPVILDDLSTGHQEAVRGYPFYQGKAENSEIVTEIVRKHKVTAAMHFSARALVAESMIDPLGYYQANVGATLALLNTLQDLDVHRFVFSSTCAIFGDPKNQTLTETSLQDPINPYGRSKRMVEQVLRDCSKTYGLRVAVLRYFNAAGADPSGEIGEDHTPETHLIPILLQAALGKRHSITIYGNDYPTLDGTCVRDYIHVNDLALGHIRALELLGENMADPSGESFFDFNLGSGRGYSNLEVLKMVETVTGKPVTYTTGARRPGDPPVLIADTTKAKSQLGWAPQFELKQIVETAYNWMQKHPNGFKTNDGAKV